MLNGLKNQATAREGASDESLAALHATLFARLDASVARLWAQARAGRFWKHVAQHGCSRELYRQTMVQIYHYTRHNSINQAVAAFRADSEQLFLLRFVYEHAREELGHEKLVAHDLKSVGLLEDGEILEPPLSATDALINYLYGVALREGPVPRLGYSYWAESAYGQIGPLLLSARKSLSLSDRNLTFFTAHSELDVQHSAEVQGAIRRVVTKPKEADAVHRVAQTSLWLTLQLLEQAFDTAESAQLGSLT